MMILPVVGRLQKLVVRVDERPAVPVGESPFRLVRRLRGDRLPDGLELKPVPVQLGGIDIDPHRRGRASADDDLPHPLDLRKFLDEDGRRGVVDIAGGSVSDVSAMIVIGASAGFTFL